MRSIVFWNVERLFAGRASVIQTELDATAPTRQQVTRKVENLRTVIRAIDRIAPIAMLGLCEVETTSLVRRLGQTLDRPLTSVDDVATDSCGFALDGLNIGLLVDRDLFDGPILVQSHVLDRTFDTRDVLECTLSSSRLDLPITVYVNHWASRLASEGEEKRVTAAHFLRSLIRDRVRFRTAEMIGASGVLRVPHRDALEARAATPVIAMGDFNDEPFDPSLSVVDTTPEIEPVLDDVVVRGRSRMDRFRSYRSAPLRLHNPFWAYASGDWGTFYRSPRWRTYDQILLGRGVLEEGQRRLRLVDDSASIYSDPDLTRRDGSPLEMTNRSGKPRRFDQVRGIGCSDHFPVVVLVDGV